MVLQSKQLQLAALYVTYYLLGTFVKKEFWVLFHPRGFLRISDHQFNFRDKLELKTIDQIFCVKSFCLVTKIVFYLQWVRCQFRVDFDPAYCANELVMNEARDVIDDS